MEEDDINLPLAICYEACKQCGQLHTKKGRGQLSPREVHWGARQTQTSPFPRIRLPHLCARQRTPERARSAQVEATCLPRHISRSIAKPCSYSGPDSKPAHRARITSVPHKVRRFFETVGNSPSGMDTPEPEWKYLSGFVIKKGATDKGSKGALTNLLTPPRGATKVTNDPAPPQIPDESPTNQQHDELTMEPFNEANDNTAPLPPAVTVPPTAHEEQQPIALPSMPAARQTRSGRTVRNTPRYEQSITQREQAGKYYATKMSKNKCRRRHHNTRYKKFAREPSRLRCIRQPRHSVLGPSHEST